MVLAAGDTFRAAATEQLDVWAERAQAPSWCKGTDGADPGAVVFDAVKQRAGRAARTSVHRRHRGPAPHQGAT